MASDLEFSGGEFPTVRISDAALARALEIAERYKNRSGLLAESVMPELERKFTDYFLYGLIYLTKVVEPSTAQLSGFSPEERPSDAFYAGMVSGVNMGWAEFGPVASLFPALGIIADTIGVGSDFRQLNPNELMAAESRLLDLGHFGDLRFSGIERFHEKVRSILCPSGRNVGYLRDGVGVGLLLYEHAARYQPCDQEATECEEN